jgi:hypothetical protein
MGQANGFHLPDSDCLMHFARRPDMVAWALAPSLSGALRDWPSHVIDRSLVRSLNCRH